MQQIRITRTADLNGVLSFLKERYPLLSEAEIIKMALSNQYYQEAAHKERKALDETPNEYFKQAIKEGREHRKQGKGSPLFTSDMELIKKDSKKYRHIDTMEQWFEEQGI